MQGPHANSNGSSHACAAHEAEITDLRAENKRLHSRIKDSEKQFLANNAALKDMLLQAQREVQVYRKQLSDSTAGARQDMVGSGQEEFKAQVEQLRQQVMVYENQFKADAPRLQLVDSLTQQLQTARDQQADTLAQLRECKQQLLEVESAKPSLDEAPQIDTPENTCHDEDLNDAHRTLSESQAECLRIVAQLERAQAHSADIQKALRTSQDRCTRLEAECTDFRKTQEQLRRLEDECNSLRGVKEHVRRLEHECALLRSAPPVAHQNEQLRQQLFAAQSESRNLKEIVTQLRSANKQQAQTIEELQQVNAQQAEELKDLNVILEDAAQTQQQHTLTLSSLEDAIAEKQRLQDQLQQLVAKYQGYSSDSMNALQQSSQELLVIKQQLFDKESELEVCAADLQLCQADLNLTRAELANLKPIINQLQRDLHSETARANRAEKAEAELKSTCHNLEAEMQRLRDECVYLCMQREEEKQKHGLLLEVEVGKADVMVKQLHRENERLKQAVEQAVEVVHSPSDDAVNKKLISNLIVAYFKRSRSLEVLELISKVLDFDDEQKSAVGLTYHLGLLLPSSPLVQSVLSFWNAPPTLEEHPNPNPSPPVSGASLAELWVNYLVMETEGQEG